MRSCVYEIVYSVMEEHKHSDDVFHGMISDGRITDDVIGSVKREAYGTIERVITLDAMIRRFADRPVTKMDADVRTLLRMGFYELMFMDSIPYYATCDEVVGLSHHTGKRGYINAILRGYIREIESDEHDDPWDRLTPNERYAMPKDLWDLLSNSFGKKTTVKISKAFLESKPGISLHVDTNKIDTNTFKERLGIPSEYGKYMADTLIIDSGVDVTKLYGYDEGYFYIQDESSYLPVLIADVKKGDTIVDVCGAPGGKAVHALMRLNDTGFVSIRDISEDKLSTVRENLRRMRFINAEVKCFDGREEDRNYAGKADVVLCDVPCSGYGIIGRKPELKFRPVTDIDELVSIQRDIVRASVSMLKPDGVLIYSTCTLTLKENELNAKWIEENLDLVPESIDEFLPHSLISTQTAKGRLQVLPGIHDMDGFFVARFRKSS